MPTFQGPIQPGTSEQIFRETGQGVQNQSLLSSARRGRIGGGGGRYSSSSSPPPAPTYESSLLNQSFSSQQALQQAEAKYKLQQAIQAKQEEQRQSRISSGRTTGQFGSTSKGTRTDLAPEFKSDQRVFVQPTIYSKQTGTSKDPFTGRNIPTYEIRYSAGALSGPGLTKDRLATSEEFDYFQSQTKTVKEGSPITLWGTAKTSYGKGKVRFDEVLDPAVKFSQKTEDLAVKAVKTKTPYELIFGESTYSKNLKEFGAGVVRGAIPSTSGEVAVTAASFGVGSVFGAGGRIVSATSTKLFPKVSPFIGKGLGYAGLSLGGAYALDKGSQFIAAPSLESKGYVFGSTSRELASFYGGTRAGEKASSVVIGRIRTRGLNEIPSDVIIAPEFTTGQTYPKIRKGQTAGQLLSEFDPTLKVNGKEIYGARRLTGFTAAGSPLSGKQFGAGSSELPGLYQAPKLSPQFLRINKKGSSPSFSVDVLGGGLPSAFKTTPEGGFSLVPGVSPKQTSLMSSNQAKKFFSTSAKPGTSYVPFIKTEKEAVIPAGTYFKKDYNRFFFEFRGERVPVFEITALKNPVNKNFKNVINTRDIISSDVGSYFSSRAVTPILGGVYSSRGRGRRSSGLSSGSSIKSLFSGSSFTKPSISYSGGKSFSSQFKSLSGSSSFPSSSSFSKGGSSRPLVTYSYITPPTKKKTPPRPDSKLRSRSKIKYKPSSAGERYSPDLGSILFGRRGKKPKRGVFGYSPGRVRPIPI